MRFLKPLKNRKGFSFAEVIITVAITAVLATVAVVVGTNYAKGLKSTEADDKAKAIYMTAQEQMTNMSSHSDWRQVISKVRNGQDANLFGQTVESMAFFGTQMSVKPSDYDYWLNISDLTEDEAWENVKNDMYYLSTNEPAHSAMLELLLPRNTMDATADGQIFIEYNLKTAKVYGVFYCEDKETCTLEYADVMDLLGNEGRANLTVSASDAKTNRKNFRINDHNMILGYYGGAIASIHDAAFLPRPEIQIINNEDLALCIKQYASDIDTDLSVIINGQTSGESAVITIDKTDETYTLNGLTYGMNYSRYTRDSEYALNQLTPIYSTATEPATGMMAEEGFEEYTGYYILIDSLMPYRAESKTGEDYGRAANYHFANLFPDFIPGEDLEVTVTATPTGTSAVMPREATAVVNSLFGSLTDTGVELHAIRHLENLSTDISGVHEGAQYNADKILHFDNAHITQDLSFTGLGIGNDQDNYLNTEILFLEENVSENTDPGSFHPINNTGLTSLSAADKKIYDLYVSAEDIHNAGLFGHAGDITIRGIGLVGSTSLSSGLQDLEGTEFGLYPIIETTCLDGEINAGAFVALGQNVTVENCYSTAVIRVYTGDTEDITEINAGGFVGKTGELAVTTSYGGGVVGNDYMYDTEAGNIFIQTPDSGADLSLAAGGIVGSVTGSSVSCSVDRSYSTQSIYVDMVSESAVPDQLCVGGLAGWIFAEEDIDAVFSDSYYMAPMTTSIKELWDISGTLAGEYLAGKTVGFGGIIGGADAVDIGIYADSAYYSEYFSDFCGIPAYMNSEDATDTYGAQQLVITDRSLAFPRRNTYGTMISDMEDFVSNAEYEALGEMISEETTYPVRCSWGSAYALYDVTGLGHHYGDWQIAVPGIYDADLPNISNAQMNNHLPDITLVVGHGIAYVTVDGDETDELVLADQTYGDVLTLEDLFDEIALKDGYDGIVFVVRENHNGSNGVIALNEDTGNHDYIVGTSDTVIEVRALTLLPPQITVSGSGRYVYNYLPRYIGVSNSRVYDKNSNIRIDYYAHYIETSSTQTAAQKNITNFTAVTPSQYWKHCEKTISSSDAFGNLAQDLAIAKNAYYGDRFYWVQAIASDGVLTSAPATTLSSGLKVVGLHRVPMVISANNYDSPPKDGVLLKNGVRAGETISMYVEYDNNMLYADASSSSGAISLANLSASRSQRTLLGWYDDVYVDFDGEPMPGTDKIAGTNGIITGSISGLCGNGKWRPTTLDTLKVYALWSQPTGMITVDP